MYLRYRQDVCSQSVFEPTANNSPTPSLPSELIVEILLRLPVRSLLQFRCVCKLWKTLISDPNFAKKHFHMSSGDPPQRLDFFVSIQFFKHASYSYSLKSLFENPPTRFSPYSFRGLGIDHYNILGSCNGFLCVYDTDQYNFMMYNPSIGLKSKCSPKLNPWLHWSILYTGFGYDHVNHKYKVLAVVKNDDGRDSDDEDIGDIGESLTNIYTFGEDSWRTIQDLPYTPLNLMNGKYVSGTLNWIARRRRDDPTRHVIISFDLDKETYRDVLLPQDVRLMNIPSLFVLNDRLGLCFENKTHLVVWLMKEYGVVESWTKLINIPRVKLIFYY